MGFHIEVKNLEDFLSSVEGELLRKKKIRNKKEELWLLEILSAFLLYVIKIYPLRLIP